MNEKLQLTSLLQYAEGHPERVAVRQLPSSLKRQDTTFEEHLFVATVQTATKLNVAGAFQFSTDGLHEIGICDMRYGTLDAYPNTSVPSNALVRGAFWGSSLRMTLKASVGHLDSAVTIGAVAARAQGGLSAVEYELTLVGDLANSLEFFAAALDGLPIMGTFDYEAYAYFKARQKVLRQLFVQLAPAKPTTVIAAELAGGLEPTAYKRTMSINYAMHCLLDDLHIDVAISRAPDVIESSVVRDTYSKLHVADSPTNASKETAREWLYA